MLLFDIKAEQQRYGHLSQRYCHPPLRSLPDQNVDVIPDISSESESLGEFGNDDTTVNDAFQDFIDNVGDSGFDFITASPDPEISPSFSPFPTPTISPLSEDDDTDIYPYANYNTYYGSISSTYLEFMRGFLPKLGFREHYVASRTSQYDYIFAYGEKLTYSGGRFTGTGITVITWNTYNYGTYSFGYQSTFSLNPGSYLVYSDLSDVYPSLADSAGFTLRQILILLTAFILGIPANEIVLPIILMSYMASGSLVDLDDTYAIGNILVQNGWSLLTAINVMIFTLLHFPCSTTLLTIKKETGSWKWVVLSFILPTACGIVICMCTTLLWNVLV